MPGNDSQWQRRTDEWIKMQEQSAKRKRKMQIRRFEAESSEFSHPPDNIYRRKK